MAERGSPKSLEEALAEFDAAYLKEVAAYQSKIDAAKKELDAAQDLERKARFAYSGAIQVKVNASFAADAARAEIERGYPKAA